MKIDVKPFEPTERLHIVTVLDRSGSMSGSEAKVISSYNELISRFKDSDPTATVSLYIFDHEITTLYEGAKIVDVQPLTSKEYAVRGMTALNDAIGYAISRNAEFTKVFFVVDTDGGENGSKEFNVTKVRELVDEKTAAGWDFTFVGTDLSAQDTASMSAVRGISAQNTMMFDKSERGFANRTDSLYAKAASYAGWVEPVVVNTAASPNTDDLKTP